MASEQATLGEAIEAKTEAVSITRTVSCQLRSSKRKNERLETAVEEFQAMMSHMADVLPSFPEGAWNATNNQFYRVVRREFPDSEITISGRCSRNAAQKVASAFKGWREKGKPGDRPRGDLGDGDYLQLTNQEYDIVPNERGYGLKARFIPREPVWWHLHIGAHQRRYIERAVDGDASFGSAEIFYNDGDPFINIPITWEQPTFTPETVQHTVGVDIGESVLWAAGVREVDTGEVVTAEMESGAEFRHHRERLSARRDALQAKGDYSGMRAASGERERYTDHVTHNAAVDIVNLAREYAPAIIYLEDLTDYRERADNPIHDWPFAELQDKIAAKANAAGIPVKIVDAAYTSRECRKCGNRDEEQRDGDTFVCLECGYEVHADINAAFNIAERGPGD